MWLRGIDFLPVANASGARGFFKEGYWYHTLWKLLGLTWKNTGFVAKTITLDPRLDPQNSLGNMPLCDDGITPREFFPRCIIPKMRSGVVLNAVGLSNPGAWNMIQRGIWQRMSGKPFHLSFMPVRKERNDRLQELRQFVLLLAPTLDQFRSHVGLEMNFSCPNANIHTSCLLQEIEESLDIASALRIPLQVKVNALAPVRETCEAANHPACDALTMGNTLPWGSMPEKIPWQKLFENPVSPLAKFGGGGLSGPLLRPIHCAWIAAARDLGFTKPIWGCGGIDCIQAVKEYKEAGASGVQLGTVCMLRPWRMKNIIRYANTVFN